jgi:thioredoxin-related protein
MKSIVNVVLIWIAFASACNQSGEATKVQNTQQDSSKINRLEVYCFHGTRQCTTCKNMKANTLKALTLNFGKQLQDSSIVFRIVDVDLPEYALLAEKFEATGTALMLNWVRQGQDSIIDMSDLAFEKANDEAIFIKDFSSTIAAFVK